MSEGRGEGDEALIEPLSSDPQSAGEDLLERVEAGDGEAFKRLVDEFAPLVGRLVAVLVDDPHEVADLVQESFLRAHRASSGYRGGEVSSWLGRIAVNVARDYHRSGWRRRVDLVDRPAGLPAPAADGPEPRAVRAEADDRIRAALARLPRKQAEAVRLRFLAGESYVAMSDLTGLPESTLRSRVKAALARLRADLGDYFTGGD